MRRFPLNSARVASLHAAGITSLSDLRRVLTALDLRATIELDIQATCDGRLEEAPPPKGKA